MYFHLNSEDNFVTELDFSQYIDGFSLNKLKPFSKSATIYWGTNAFKVLTRHHSPSTIYPTHYRIPGF